MSKLRTCRPVRPGNSTTSSVPDVKTVWLFGIPVQAATLGQALDRIHAAIVQGDRLQLGVINAAKIVNMDRNPDLGDAVHESDVIYADGMSVVWASRLLRKPLPERIAGIDIMLGILKRGQHHKYKVFCLGATRDVVTAVCDKFEADFPGIRLVGHCDGYFDLHEEKEVAKAVRDAKPDVLFVAITSPKKEKFMAKWAQYMNVPVVHGVGGSFDVVAGLVQRAPESWQKLGLEWLYRVKQEPRRLWKRYLVTNFLFIAILLQEIFRQRDSNR